MIESLHSAIATDAKVIFKSRKEQLSKEGFSVVVSHFGVFSQDLINSLSSGVEDLLISSGDKKHIVKKAVLIRVVIHIGYIAVMVWENMRWIEREVDTIKFFALYIIAYQAPVKINRDRI